MTRLRPALSLLATALLAGAAACSDSTGGGNGGTPPGALSYILLADTAPTLCADSIGAWFTKDPNGQDSTIALEFPTTPAGCGGQREEFISLKLKKLSLLRRPDNTLIANGDSVFISIKWVGSDSILFDLRPSGLLFTPGEEAELKIEYGQAGDDLDDDGDVDVDDDLVEDQIDIWRQENPGDDFVQVGTAKLEDSNEIEAKLSGFSRYAIAY
jgi:hypothetical protein